MTITALYASGLRVPEIWSWCVCQLLWPSLYGMLVASEYLKSGPDVFVFYHFPRFLQFICLVCSFDWLMLILLIACRTGSFSGSWTFIIVDFYNTNLIHVYKCHWIGQDLFFNLYINRILENTDTSLVGENEMKFISLSELIILRCNFWMLMILTSWTDILHYNTFTYKIYNLSVTL